ncbi:hypothetical protein O0L34_g14875 [Tuta absoluta]|nr:hypothetical protein O0L34_g14875 [Tuta absoluta]
MQQLTDVSVRVRATNVDHYKALRLTLALDNNLHTPLYSTKLDASGYSQYNNPGVMYVLPRLPADNKTYVLQLESSLSKSTHSYEEEVHYFNSDGKFKAFDIEFSPKVKSSEQELRQTSLLVIPLLGVLVLAYCRRDLLLAHASQMANNALRPTKNNSREPRQTRQELLDKASIDHILSTVTSTPPGSGPPRRKPCKHLLLYHVVCVSR